MVPCVLVSYVGGGPLAQTLVFMSQAELKAALHARIDALDGPHLALVERVFLTLEAEELSGQLGAGFDADQQAGLLAPARIEAALAEARAARPYR